MSTTALHLIELIRSLPMADQQAVREALTSPMPVKGRAGDPGWERSADGGYFDAEGIPNEHPFFAILESEAHAPARDFGPPPPDFA